MLSDKSKDYIVKVIDRWTPFKGLLEMGLDLATPLAVKQLDDLVLEEYLPEEYWDDLNAFIEALDDEDLDAARAALDVLSDIIPGLPFLESEKANDLVYESLSGLLQATIEEILYRKENAKD